MPSHIARRCLTLACNAVNHVFELCLHSLTALLLERRLSLLGAEHVATV